MDSKVSFTKNKSVALLKVRKTKESTCQLPTKFIVKTNYNSEKINVKAIITGRVSGTLRRLIQLCHQIDQGLLSRTISSSNDDKLNLHRRGGRADHTNTQCGLNSLTSPETIR